MCRPVVRSNFNTSSIMIGLLAVEEVSRWAICVRERGLDRQRIIVASSGPLSLVESLSRAVRLVLLNPRELLRRSMPPSP